jgi:hypothetical protein
VEKQSDKRMLLIAALVFGLVITAVSVRWLTIGEIVIRRDNEQGRVVGTIKSDHALFYPVCAVWGLLGLLLLVLTPVAYFRHDEFLMKISAYCCAALLPLGLATVLVAWLAT